MSADDHAGPARRDRCEINVGLLSRCAVASEHDAGHSNAFKPLRVYHMNIYLRGLRDANWTAFVQLAAQKL